MMLVYALDGLDQIAQITTWDRLELEQHDLDIGTWVIEGPVGGLDSVPNRWLNAPNPGIEIVDPDTDFRFAGPLLQCERTIRTTGASTYKAVGTDFQVELARRLNTPTPHNLSEWWKANEPDIYESVTLALTSACYHIVNVNAGPAAPVSSRAIPGLEFGPDPGAGGAKTFMPSGATLLDELAAWLTDTPYTARLRLKRNAAGAPSLLFECGARPYSTFVLNESTVPAWTVIDSTAAATRIFAMGGTWQAGVNAERVARGLSPEDPDPPVRYFTEGSNPGVGSSWQTPHVEKFINRPSSTFEFPAAVGSLADDVADEIRNNGPRRALHIPDVTVASFGKYFEVGWLVPTALLSEDQGATSPSWTHLPVTSFRYVHDAEDGETRTVSIGDKVGGPADGIFQAINATERAVKTLEAMLGRLQ